MASIETRIDNFMAEHELDSSIKDPLCALITESMNDLFKHVFSTPVPTEGSAENKKSKKVLKSDKVEDPTSCETIEDLRNCTTGILNQFCKDNGLKVGGNKKEIIDRVWRHMQGEGSDEDKSSRGKPKSEKKVPEKHVCSGTNVAGVPCGSSGTEEHGGCYFCWRHVEDADKFLARLGKAPATKPAESKPQAKPTETSEPVAKSKAKAPKVSAVVVGALAETLAEPPKSGATLALAAKFDKKNKDKNSKKKQAEEISSNNELESEDEY